MPLNSRHCSDSVLRPAEPSRSQVSKSPTKWLRIHSPIVATNRTEDAIVRRLSKRRFITPPERGRLYRARAGGPAEKQTRHEGLAVQTREGYSRLFRPLTRR